MTKKELLQALKDKGIDANPKATVRELEALLSGNRAMRVSCGGYAALNVRMAPSIYSPVVAAIPDGEEVEVESIENGWAKVPGGFAKAEFLA